MNDAFQKLVEYNKKFVEEKAYGPFQCEATPKKEMVILSCMDSRLTQLLPAALGIQNGDVKMVKNAGAMITNRTGSAMRSLIVAIYAFNISNVMVIAHDDCGMSNVDNSHLVDNMLARGITPDAIQKMDTEHFDTLKWLEGFANVETSVKHSVNMIQTHPLISKDIAVHGFVMDPTTGALRQVI